MKTIKELIEDKEVREFLNSDEFQAAIKKINFLEILENLPEKTLNTFVDFMKSSPFSIYKTDRLLLIPFNGSDRFKQYAFKIWEDDPLVKQSLDSGRDVSTRSQSENSIDNVAAQFERGIPALYFLYSIEKKILIGMIKSEPLIFPFITNKVITITLYVEKPYQRKGYMREALRTFLPDVLSKYNLRFIYTDYVHANTASRKLLKALNFHEIIRLPLRGQTHVSVVYPEKVTKKEYFDFLAQEKEIHLQTIREQDGEEKLEEIDRIATEMILQGKIPFVFPIFTVNY